MKRVTAIVCLLFGGLAGASLLIWLGRVYYFAGGITESFSQLQLLGSEALMFGGTLAGVAVLLICSGLMLLANSRRHA